MSPRTDPWQVYRRLRRVLFGAALVGLGCFGVGFHLARTRHAVTPFYVGLAVWVGMIAWGAMPLGEFPCPRCGEPFSQRGRTRNLLSRRCLHCQLPKWANPES
jgi:hypothetical protein